jgi:hypothetical protein
MTTLFAGNEAPERLKLRSCSHVFLADDDRTRDRYGSQCRARPLAGKELCAAHDPEHRRAMAERKEARRVTREEWKAQIRAEQIALKDNALRRAQGEVAERQAERDAARAVRRAVPQAVRVAHRRAQLNKSERQRITLYLRPYEVAALHDWFEIHCGGVGHPS